MDKDKFIPFKETFNHISFGMRAVAQTSAGIKGALKDRLKAKNTQIRKERLNAHRICISIHHNNGNQHKHRSQKSIKKEFERSIYSSATSPNTNN